MRAWICLIAMVGLVVSSPVQRSLAASNEALVAAVDAYENTVMEKLNSDLETIGRAFADAREIQKARQYADVAKVFLAGISLIIGSKSIIENPQLLLADLDKAQGQLEVVSIFFKLHAMWESVQGLRLARNGPEYNEAVRRMLAEADKSLDKKGYQTELLLYLHGVGGRRSPVPVVVDRSQQPLQGVREFKDRIRSLVATTKGNASKLSALPEAELKTLVTEIQAVTARVKESKSKSVEVAPGLSLGRINAREMLRMNALSNYDRDMAIEQSNTISSAVDSICSVVNYSGLGSTLGVVRDCVLVGRLGALTKSITLTYKTSARKQVDELPFEMLLSLPAEAESLWRATKSIADKIRGDGVAPGSSTTVATTAGKGDTGSSAATPSLTFRMKDGSTVSGQLKDESIKVKSSVGTATVPVKDIVSFSPGELRLKDGNVLKGELVASSLAVASKYGTLQLNAKDMVWFGVGTPPAVVESGQSAGATTTARSGAVKPEREIAEYLGLREGLVKTFVSRIVSPGAPARDGSRSLVEVEKKTSGSGAEVWRRKTTFLSSEKWSVREYSLRPGAVELIGYEESGKAYQRLEPPGSTLNWPLKPGTKMGSGASSYEVLAVEDVDTLAGRFSGCLKTGGKAGSIWYCRGVGVVKSDFQGPQGRTLVTLDDVFPRYGDVRYQPKSRTGETAEQTRRRLAGAQTQSGSSGPQDSAGTGPAASGKERECNQLAEKAKGAIFQALYQRPGLVSDEDYAILYNANFDHAHQVVDRRLSPKNYFGSSERCIEWAQDVLKRLAPDARSGQSPTSAPSTPASPGRTAALPPRAPAPSPTPQIPAAKPPSSPAPPVSPSSPAAPLSAQAGPGVPIPRQYGVYLVADGRLIELRSDLSESGTVQVRSQFDFVSRCCEHPEHPSVPQGVIKILVYDRGLPSFDVYLRKYYYVRKWKQIASFNLGTVVKVQEKVADLQSWVADPEREFRTKIAPVPGQQDMVVIETIGVNVPGLYALRLKAKSLPPFEFPRSGWTVFKVSYSEDLKERMCEDWVLRDTDLHQAASEARGLPGGSDKLTRHPCTANAIPEAAGKTEKTFVLGKGGVPVGPPTVQGPTSTPSTSATPGGIASLPPASSQAGQSTQVRFVNESGGPVRLQITGNSKIEVGGKRWVTIHPGKSDEIPVMTGQQKLRVEQVKTAGFLVTGAGARFEKTVEIAPDTPLRITNEDFK